MTDEDLGKLAYKLWVKHHFRRSPTNWDNLPDVIQRGWIAVGTGIVKEFLP